jgi:hypothetical protein
MVQTLVEIEFRIIDKIVENESLRRSAKDLEKIILGYTRNFGLINQKNFKLVSHSTSKD